MSNRRKLRQVAPDTAAREQIKTDLRCWQCAAEPKLSFTTKRGLAASIEHLADCRAVPAEHRAAGRLVHTVEPVVYRTELR
jgi:hypothetical protein